MADLSMPAPKGGTTPTRRLVAAGVIRRAPNRAAPTAEPSDLAVAVELGHRMLASPSDVGVREALRILLRAVEQDTVRRSVDAQFPVIAAFLADERGGR